MCTTLCYELMQISVDVDVDECQASVARFEAYIEWFELCAIYYIKCFTFVFALDRLVCFITVLMLTNAMKYH